MGSANGLFAVSRAVSAPARLVSSTATAHGSLLESIPTSLPRQSELPREAAAGGFTALICSIVQVDSINYLGEFGIDRG